MNLKNCISLIAWFYIITPSLLHAGDSSLPTAVAPIATVNDTSSVSTDLQPFFDDFNNIDPAVWDVANYTWPTSGSFQQPSQVSASNSILTITMEPAATPIQGRNVISGTLSSRRLFKYGKFSAKMKNKLVPGVDNCFFLMSPWQAKGWHHQEVDFEFLGKNPSQVQVTLHKYIDNEGTPQNGGMLPKMIDLGFDSTKAFHVYTIELLNDRINFFVDDKQVWTETRNQPDMGLMISLSSFLVNQDTSWGAGWAGKFGPETLPASVQFDWVKYEPLPNGSATKP